VRHMDGTFLSESHSQKSHFAHHNSGATSGKGTLLLVTLTLMLTLPGSKFLGQEPARQPSVLGAFLTRVTNASVRKKEVGVLTGPNTDRATFTAIVAWEGARIPPSGVGAKPVPCAPWILAIKELSIGERQPD
jgi:hypothetical protein